MGFFSWNTGDTNEPIMNRYTPHCKTVYLYCPDGVIIKEEAYDGYGVFGGHDAYALLARWNKPHACCGDDNIDREVGIRI